MLKNFRTYQLSKELYIDVKDKGLPLHAKDQLQRASLSISLNLAEGSGKRTPRDRKRFYQMALGSLREVQAILDIYGTSKEEKAADHLGACIWKLLQRPGSLNPDD